MNSKIIDISKKYKNVFEELLLTPIELHYLINQTLISIDIAENENNKDSLIAYEDILEEAIDYDILSSLDPEIKDSDLPNFKILLHVFELDYFVSLIESGRGLAEIENNEIKKKVFTNLLFEKVLPLYRKYSDVARLFWKNSQPKRADLLCDALYNRED